MVDVVRQNSTIHCELYFFPIGKDKWELNYSSFSYPSELDKPREAVEAGLTIQQTYHDKLGKFKDSKRFFSEAIYLNGGVVTLRCGSILGFSPVLKGFNELELKVKKEVFGELSDEARSLLEKGLEVYEAVKN